MNLKFLIYTLSSYQLPVLISSSSWQKYPASFLPFAPLCLLQVTTFTLVVSKNSRFPPVFLRSCELTKNKFPHTTPQQKTRTITLNDKTLLNSTRITCFPSVQCTMLGIQSFGQRPSAVQFLSRCIVGFFHYIHYKLEQHCKMANSLYSPARRGRGGVWDTHIVISYILKISILKLIIVSKRRSYTSRETHTSQSRL